MFHVCCYLTEMDSYATPVMPSNRYLSEFICKFIEAVEEPTQIFEVLRRVCFMAYITVLFSVPLGAVKFH